MAIYLKHLFKEINKGSAWA